MGIDFAEFNVDDLNTVIKVVGVGGGGNNAVNCMVSSGIQGVEFIVINTDAEVLEKSLAPVRLQIGRKATEGKGAGARPEVGAKAAEENRDEIKAALEGADMVFIAAGMGGGRAKEGVAKLSEHVDSIITIPNEKLLNIIDRNTPFTEAFHAVDDILRQGVQSIADLINESGFINVDFADVETIMSDAGPALMGIGEGTGDNACLEAVKAAVGSPLLEVSVQGARSVIINFKGVESRLNMAEMTEASEAIREAAHVDAEIVWGVSVDESMGDKILATVVATRFDDNTAQQPSQPTDAHQFFGTQPANSNQQAGNGMRNSTFGSNADKGMPNQDFFTVNNIDIPVWMRK